MQGSSARVLSSAMGGVALLDDLWSKALVDLMQDALHGAAACTEAIFKLSFVYVRRDAYEALTRFYELYFDKANHAKKEAINAEVDEIFDAAVASLKQSGNIDINAVVKEDEGAKKARLAIAGLQKQLEGLIVLDEGIRNEILPALSSMQFEDSMRQRVEHIMVGWQRMIASQDQILRDGSAVTCARELSKITSSVNETETYYKVVLNEDPPREVLEGNDQGSVLLF